MSFLSDDVIFQRYVEIEGRMHKVMTVIKMRGGAHSKDLRLYDATEGGLVVGNTLYDYRGVITGVAQRHQASESGTQESTPNGRCGPCNDLTYPERSGWASASARSSGIPRVAPSALNWWTPSEAREVLTGEVRRHRLSADQYCEMMRDHFRIWSEVVRASSQPLICD